MDQMLFALLGAAVGIVLAVVGQRLFSLRRRRLSERAVDASPPELLGSGHALLPPPPESAGAATLVDEGRRGRRSAFPTIPGIDPGVDLIDAGTESVPRTVIDPGRGMERFGEPDLRALAGLPDPPRPYAGNHGRFGPDLRIRVGTELEQVTVDIPIDTTMITVGSGPTCTINVAGAAEQVMIMTDGPVAMVARLDDPDGTPVAKLGSVDIHDVAVPVTRRTSMLRLRTATLDLADLAPSADLGWRLLHEWSAHSVPVRSADTADAIGIIAGSSRTGGDQRPQVMVDCWASNAAMASNWSLDAALGHDGVGDGEVALAAGVFVTGSDPFMGVSAVGFDRGDLSVHRWAGEDWQPLELSWSERASGAVASVRTPVGSDTRLAVSGRLPGGRSEEIGFVLGAAALPLSYQERSDGLVPKTF